MDLYLVIFPTNQPTNQPNQGDPAMSTRIQRPTTNLPNFGNMAIWRSLENHLNCFVGDTLPETNSKFAPENRPVYPKKETTVVFQPSIFRCENVSFREATSSFMLVFSTIGMLIFLESSQTLNQIFPLRPYVHPSKCL